jgi:CRP-like cAMP-binding protein
VILGGFRWRLSEGSPVKLPQGNLIVDRIAELGEAELLRNATVEHLRAAEITTVGRRTMATVDLPVTALMSVFGLLDDGSTSELASVGPEGFVEIDAALRTTVARRSAVCLFEGDVVRLPLADFQRAILASEHFAHLVYFAVRTRVFITEQIEMCNARHSVGERLSRWILLACLRSGAVELPITHEQLASVLGVRRATISVAIAALEQDGVISAKRGMVLIADRERLEATTCECWHVCHEVMRESAAP